jgi:DNA-binding response OmpR family regulator
MQYETQVRNSRILLVDDLIANVSLLENILNRLAYKQIRNLTDPLQVAAVVEEWKPDIIVLDLAIESQRTKVMEQLRNQISKEDWIPILVLTADTDPGTKRKALAAGATEFLAKPFDSSEIVLRIRNLLLMRILRAELQNQNEILEERVAARTRSLSERTEQLEQALAELKTTQQQVVQQERFRAFGEPGASPRLQQCVDVVIGYTDLLLGGEFHSRGRKRCGEFLRTMNTAGHDAPRSCAAASFYRPRSRAEIFTPIDLNAVQEGLTLTQPRSGKPDVEHRRGSTSIRPATLPSVMCNPADMRGPGEPDLQCRCVPNGGPITGRAAGGVSHRCERRGTGVSVSPRAA